MINVGITVRVADGWLGGLNYFKSLAVALNNISSKEVHVFFLTNDAAALSHLNGKTVTVKESSRVFCPSLLIRFLRKITSIDFSLWSESIENDITIFTHVQPGRYSRVPEVFWMPDFQHKYYPEFFNSQELLSRDNAIRSTAWSREILFSSASAERDFRQFYPELTDVRSHVLRFAPILDVNAIGAMSESSIREKYKLRNTFFYLPNQFWKHKNHQVVVEALSALSDDFVVVCSGETRDHRNPEYIQQLLAKVSSAGLNDRFKILGVVPREDMYALFNYAVAVINPSLFEGWSTTVEEAKYIGKRLILSDISVHREQNPADALYFPADRADQLADCMRRIVVEYDPKIEVARKSKAALAYPGAVENFALDYIDIIKSCMEKM
ncbi:conserved hypothetical protein [Pseudomonas sp. 8AS]|nr:conserved hypothetical protein [Pseudomonas sp. 8AS]